MRKLGRRLSLALFPLAGLGAAFGACGGEMIIVGEDAGARSADAGALARDAMPPPPPAPTATPVQDGGKPPPKTPVTCTADVDCNEDQTVSSLQGQCFQGMCVCNGSSHVQPSGKCGAAEPPGCAQSGGVCKTFTNSGSPCSADEITGARSTNESCGDPVNEFCCMPWATCKASVDLVCCDASYEVIEATCVNGWRSCDGLRPSVRERGCL